MDRDEPSSVGVCSLSQTEALHEAAKRISPLIKIKLIFSNLSADGKFLQRAEPMLEVLAPRIDLTKFWEEVDFLKRLT